jgi:hypothetical protein
MLPALGSQSTGNSTLPENGNGDGPSESGASRTFAPLASLQTNGASGAGVPGTSTTPGPLAPAVTRNAPVLTAGPVHVPPFESPVSTAFASSAPAAASRSANTIASHRPGLVRELQKELRRVGCYSGGVDGKWNASVQSGLRDFLARVNASLPTDEPDFVQLTLIQGHHSQACGSGKPAQVADIPQRAPAVAAPQTARAAEPLAPRRPLLSGPSGGTSVGFAVPSPVPAVRSPVPAGRMAVGGPIEAFPSTTTPGTRYVVPAPSNPDNGFTVRTASTPQDFAPQSAPVVSPLSPGTQAVSPSVAQSSEEAPPKRTRKASVSSRKRANSLNNPDVARKLFFGVAD